MSLETSLSDRVEAGARFLDTAVPDWADRVEPDLLDMWDQNWCVLGQLYYDDALHTENSAYTHGLDQLGLTATVGEYEHGFDLRVSDGDRWADLDELWTQQIEARRGVIRP